ncbi:MULTISPECIES: branched-chain amino acid ABC transporter ATP-binding protein/permease [unclassified Bradyrhizobium]|uniref:branched-chain amino acid ABC transporter ATP-binding protein/permease n=1 Tax=unclassified Bradyrhizobium TaxID=2631580 RepID=UPI00247865E2|nr:MULTISPECIES: branched-chain amino acid ABC transporter ATP-binding protein/permease [unclassified Bradyrhizobium]WGS18828.1 branched-chain amino acid ABC transporter ATP-binding protein/permease [Bradyrhizobium sp. ISRA463]WGS25656.1 branched-chain amino acid ABC transporter ATP-binding protein/permease [Bradyrhizobium sp. ISRA464]
MSRAVIPFATQAAALGVALALPAVVGANSYALFVATQLGIYIIAAIGLNLLAGYAGQVSLGHAAFVAIGAYSVALLTVDHQWPFWAAAVVGMVLAAALGVLAALPAFRLNTWYFAFITLAFALVFEKMIVEWRWLTKGFAGVVGVPPPSAFGYEFGPRPLYYTVVAVTIIAFILVRNVVHSRFGRAFVAVRDVEPAALAVGASPQRTKLVAFVMSAALAGIAGAFFAVQKTVVTPDDFTADFSIFFLLTVVLGGLGTLWGPIIGALVFFLIPELLAGLQSWRMLIYGGMLLGLMLFAPHGLYGALRQVWRRFAGPSPRASAAAEASEAREHPPIAGLALAISGLRKQFGGVQALDGVDLSVPAGSCCAIVGPNGSGKTTLLNLASGYYVPDAGSVKIGDVEALGSGAQWIAARGVGRTFQTPRLVADLTALDNVMLGAYTRERAGLLSTALRLPFARAEARRLRQEALGFLQFVGVADRADVEAGEIPHGQQRLIEIARAMIGGARLILLDEPAAGLSMSELERLERLIMRICGLGATIVIVEHHLDLVANVASHVTVLDRGTVLAAGKPAAVFNDGRVMRAYMGERALKAGVPA